MAAGRYLRPPWGMRKIGNRIAPFFARSVLSTLTVPGRTTGVPRHTPLAVYAHGGERYLIAPRGQTDWVRNLRAAGRGQLARAGRTEEFVAVEVPVAERPPLIEGYLKEFRKFPTVARTFRQLPDPADHPIFRIEPGATGE